LGTRDFDSDIAYSSPFGIRIYIIKLYKRRHKPTIVFMHKGAKFVGDANEGVVLDWRARDLGEDPLCLVHIIR
jgi:hypothetical protein